MGTGGLGSGRMWQSGSVAAALSSCTAGPEGLCTSPCPWCGDPVLPTEVPSISRGWGVPLCPCTCYPCSVNSIPPGMLSKQQEAGSLLGCTSMCLLLIIDHLPLVVKRCDCSTFPAAMEEPWSPTRLGHSHHDHAQWWWVQLLRDAAEMSLWGLLIPCAQPGSSLATGTAGRPLYCLQSSSASAEEASGRARVGTPISRMPYTGDRSQNIPVTQKAMPSAWAGTAGPAADLLSPTPGAPAGWGQLQLDCPLSSQLGTLELRHNCGKNH